MTLTLVPANVFFSGRFGHELAIQIFFVSAPPRDLGFGLDLDLPDIDAVFVQIPIVFEWDVAQLTFDTSSYDWRVSSGSGGVG